MAHRAQTRGPDLGPETSRCDAEWLSPPDRAPRRTSVEAAIAAGRAIDRAVSGRERGPLLLNSRGVRMDRHSATRRLHRLAAAAGPRMPNVHPHMLRHTYVTTMLDAGVDLRDVQIAARHADPRTTMRYDVPARTSTATPTTSSPPTWPPPPSRTRMPN